MGITKGDYILLDYTVISKDDGKVLETTIEEVAREAGIYRPEDVYRPRLVMFGETKLFEPLEERLASIDVGQEFEVEVPPEKAYGNRDPANVKVMNIRELHRRGILPKPGDALEIDGRVARVISISGGRVTLDFNHPLAGRTLIVRGKVVRKLESEEEKVRYLVWNYLPRLDPGKVEVSLDSGKIVVKLPPETLLIEKIGLVKLQIASDLGERFKDMSSVQFVEEIEFKRPEEKKE